MHGEVTDPVVDTFDREKVFIETILGPLVQRLPNLKVVMEHITTSDAVRFVESCRGGIFLLLLNFFLKFFFYTFIVVFDSSGFFVM